MKQFQPEISFHEDGLTLSVSFEYTIFEKIKDFFTPVTCVNMHLTNGSPTANEIYKHLSKFYNPLPPPAVKRTKKK